MIEASVAEGRRRYVRCVARLGAKTLPPGGEAAVDAILALVPLAASRIIDAGCGTGFLASELGRARPLAEVLGLDADGRVIEAARRRARRLSPAAPNVRFDRADARDLAIACAGADVVVCRSDLFAGRPSARRAMARALGPTSTVIDAGYVYDARVPDDLCEAARVSLGVVVAPTSTRAYLDAHERAGLMLQRFQRLTPQLLSDAPGAELYRSILEGVPGMRGLVDAMRTRRALANALAPYRAAVVASLGPQMPTGRRRVTLARALAALLDRVHTGAAVHLLGPRTGTLARALAGSPQVSIAPDRAPGGVSLALVAPARAPGGPRRDVPRLSVEVAAIERQGLRLEAAERVDAGGAPPSFVCAFRRAGATERGRIE